MFTRNFFALVTSRMLLVALLSSLSCGTLAAAGGTVRLGGDEYTIDSASGVVKKELPFGAVIVS